MSNLVSKDSLRLSDDFSPLFILGSQLRDIKEAGSVEGLRTKILELFRIAEKEAKNRNVPDQIFQQARYAVAAFLDEMILGSSWSLRDQWFSRSLQYEFSGENMAGVEFFTKLDAIRRGVPFNSDLLEIYYFCLVIGFEGQYKIHGREKLKQLIDEVGKEIMTRRKESPTLSPSGRRPDELINSVSDSLPAWVIFAASAGFIFLLFTALSFLVSHDADSLVRYLNQLGEVHR